MAKVVELVFRTVGERTSALALKLAIQSIQPESVHVIENVTPFWRAVQEMLAIPFRGDYVVFMDADCLIFEDLRPFIEENERPHIDACLLDKFRGRVAAGVHITRLDLIEQMRTVRIDAHDPGYYLKPESWIRHRALQGMKTGEGLKRFDILHDFEQDYEDVFAKLVLRDLRSRKRFRRLALNQKMKGWFFDDPDFIAAREAVRYSRNHFWPYSSHDVHDLLPGLPEIARQQIQELGLEKKSPFIEPGLEALRISAFVQQELRRPPLAKKIIGMALNPVDIEYLRWALEVFGLIVYRNYIAAITPEGFSIGLPPQSLEEDFDGMIGVDLAPFYRHLHAAYPDGQFILIKGGPESWLAEMESAYPSRRMQIQRAMKRVCPGLPSDPTREEWIKIYQDYHREVENYFQDSPGNFLLFDLTKGHGWKELCEFLNMPMIEEQFIDYRV